VCLSFAPDGCEFAEPEPVLLSDGYMRNAAGVAAAPRLPDAFRCTYTHSASFTPLRIHLARQVDNSATTTGILSSPGAGAGAGAGGFYGSAAAASSSSYGRRTGVSPCEAVAQGYPLAVSLHVPLWLVNGTQLPVSCG
ncbi:hypothetical protein Agub_g14850, partial [Astrephomene gubernaculifera]